MIAVGVVAKIKGVNSRKVPERFLIQREFVHSGFHRVPPGGKVLRGNCRANRLQNADFLSARVLGA